MTYCTEASKKNRRPREADARPPEIRSSARRSAKAPSFTRDTHRNFPRRCGEAPSAIPSGGRGFDSDSVCVVSVAKHSVRPNAPKRSAPSRLAAARRPEPEAPARARKAKWPAGWRRVNPDEMTAKACVGEAARACGGRRPRGGAAAGGGRGRGRRAPARRPQRGRGARRRVWSFGARSGGERRSRRRARSGRPALRAGRAGGRRAREARCRGWVGREKGGRRRRRSRVRAGTVRHLGGVQRRRHVQGRPPSGEGGHQAPRG